MFAHPFNFFTRRPTLIPHDDVEKALSRLCAPPAFDKKLGQRPCISDEDFQRIASLLKDLEKHLRETGWSSRPRTYTVLRMIGYTDLMPAFIALGLKDYSFPYSVDKLPEVLHDDSMKDRFLDAQKHVLTQAISLENGAEGIHAHTKNGEDLYYAMRHLGSGGYGSVDLVYSRLSFNQYARKRFVRPRNSQKDQQLLKRFDREISSLKRLSHQHLVSMIGSYTDQRSVAYLMKPVGECNLYEYLCLPRQLLDQRLPSLRNYFGCLANAVAYLHRQRIRHRDLKPQNILIKNHDVYITDFGTALDWSKRGRDTTNDPTTPFTEQYMAPEVAKRSASPRNSASDVWSLGVVFLDMVTVLRGSTISELRMFLQTHGNWHPCVWNNSSATNEWFTKLRQMDAGPESDNEPMIWIKDMLQFSAQNRPSSGALTNQIRSAAALGLFIGHCCGIDDETENYPSPPLSEASDEDTEFYVDDMPAELLGDKPFGSLIESSRQSSIERWLGVDSNQDDFISHISSEPPEVFEGNPVDPAYDIVEDESTVTTAIADQNSPETHHITSRPFKTVDTGEGYEIVQDDSDEEEQAISGGFGYEVMEDSSGSEATIRQAPTARILDPDHDVCGTEAIVDPSIDRMTVSSEDIQHVENHLDALEASTGEESHGTDSQEPLTSTRLESLNTSNTTRGATSSVLPPQISHRSQQRQNNMARILEEEPQGTDSQEPLTSERLESLNASNTTRGATSSVLPPQISHRSRQRQNNMARILEEEPQGTDSQEPLTSERLESLNASNTTRGATSSVLPPQISHRSRQRQNNMARILAEEPQITPSIYMQEVWEAASSAPTSVMSERTRKAFGSFGSGLAWQDRSANFLEKYVKMGKAAAVRELLRAGCNPGTKHKPRIRPLMLGVKGGSQRHNKCVAALLLAGADVDARDRSGRTALHYAIEHQNFHGYTNLIRDLLEAGADPNNRDRSGDFPLLQILYGGYDQLEKHKRDALACLLQQNFATDVNIVHEGTGNTPVHLAVRRKDPWAVSMLIIRGADVNTPNGSGSTPLMLAANGWSMKMSPGQNKVLQFLLDGGAKVNEQNELGKTPLHFAASHLCERAVGLLLDKGADPLIEDTAGHRASHYAGNSRDKILKAPGAHATIMEMLFEAMGFDQLSTLPSAENECSVVTAVSKSALSAAHTLFSNGAQPNYLYRSIQKTPLLHVALRTQDKPMVRFLIEKGAFVDTEDEHGDDALKVCNSLGDTDFARSITYYLRHRGKRLEPVARTD